MQSFPGRARVHIEFLYELLQSFYTKQERNGCTAIRVIRYLPVNTVSSWQQRLERTEESRPENPNPQENVTGRCNFLGPTVVLYSSETYFTGA